MWVICVRLYIADYEYLHSINQVIIYAHPAFKEKREKLLKMCCPFSPKMSGVWIMGQALFTSSCQVQLFV